MDIITLRDVKDNVDKIQGYRRYIKKIDWDKPNGSNAVTVLGLAVPVISIRTLRYDGKEYSSVPMVNYLNHGDIPGYLHSKHSANKHIKRTLYYKESAARFRKYRFNYNYRRGSTKTNFLHELHNLVVNARKRTGEYVIEDSQKTSEFVAKVDIIYSTCVVCGAAYEGVRSLSRNNFEEGDEFYKDVRTYICQPCLFLASVCMAGDRELVLGLDDICLVRIDTDELRKKD